MSKTVLIHAQSKRIQRLLQEQSMSWRAVALGDTHRELSTALVWLLVCPAAGPFLGSTLCHRTDGSIFKVPRISYVQYEYFTVHELSNLIKSKTF